MSWKGILNTSCKLTSSVYPQLDDILWLAAFKSLSSTLTSINQLKTFETFTTKASTFTLKVLLKTADVACSEVSVRSLRAMQTSSSTSSHQGMFQASSYVKVCAFLFGTQSVRGTRDCGCSFKFPPPSRLLWWSSKLPSIASSSKLEHRQKSELWLPRRISTTLAY